MICALLLYILFYGLCYWVSSQKDVDIALLLANTALFFSITCMVYLFRNDKTNRKDE